MNNNFDDIWEENYSKGQALNKYPYGELVSIFFNPNDSFSIHILQEHLLA